MSRLKDTYRVVVIEGAAVMTLCAALRINVAAGCRRCSRRKHHRSSAQTSLGIFLTPPPYPPTCAELDKQQIIATATLVVELKFIRGCGKAGHIEDVVVDSTYRGLRLGLRVIEALMQAAQARAGGREQAGWRGESLQMLRNTRGRGKHIVLLKLPPTTHNTAQLQFHERLCACLPTCLQSWGCYKVILDCSEDNVPFYNKCGLTKKEVQMVRCGGGVATILACSTFAPFRGQVDARSMKQTC